MGKIAISAMLTGTLVFGQVTTSVEYQFLRTFGSKYGIHSGKIIDRRPATIAVGRGEFPYGIAFPTAVTVDRHRRVWIADSATASVHVFDIIKGSYREFRRLEETYLRQPAGIATDAQGRVYVTDSASGGIYVFNQEGDYDHPLFSRNDKRLLESPTAMGIAENGGTLYVLDPPQHAVVALNREGESVGRIHLPDELNNPSGIAIVDNQVYVLGEIQHRVEIFSPGGRLLGEQRWEGVRAPSALAWDAVRRRFLVANPQWMVVEIFNEQGHELGAFGQKGSGVEQIEGIDALYVDEEGLVYVVDSHHGKVVVYSQNRMQQGEDNLPR